MASEYKKLLGARHVVDPRAYGYLLAPRLKEAPTPPEANEWAIGPILDQNEHPNAAGHLGTCVGHGWTAWRNAAPVQPATPLLSDYAIQAYDYAQSVDEWSDTPPEEGTSVQAGAKAMVRDGALGAGYLWARSLSELVTWLGNYGSAVVGTLWREGMFHPDGLGFVKPTGGIAGGHCYHVYGYDGFRGYDDLSNVRLKFQNSWGETWGDGGRFYMSGDAWNALLSSGDASVCTPAELAPEAPDPEPAPAPPVKARVKVSLSALYKSPYKYYDKDLTIESGRRARWDADAL